MPVPSAECWTPVVHPHLLRGAAPAVSGRVGSLPGPTRSARWIRVACGAIPKAAATSSGSLVFTKSRRRMPPIVRGGYPQPPSDLHALVSFPDSSTRALATARRQASSLNVAGGRTRGVLVERRGGGGHEAHSDHPAGSGTQRGRVVHAGRTA
jgi:hypothetical protein